MALKLKRDVSLPEAIMYCVGTIVGAGIYALIGISAGITGYALWMSFILAAIIAGLTAFSYMKLVAMFPREAAESVYVLNAFKNKKLAFFIGYVSLVTTIFSVATVAWGFATYFKLLVDISPVIIALGAICFFALINFIGIDKSVKITSILIFFSVLGLVILILFGLKFVGSVNLLVGISGETGLALFPAIFASTALIFFAFLGFEGLANISEEIENPRKNAPKAIIIALCITTLIYVLISAVSVSVVEPSLLANAADAGAPLTQGPLALVADAAIAPGAGVWISILALFATSSTMLSLLVVSSRILYGLSEGKLLPKFLSDIHPKTGTPFKAILIATIFCLVFAALGNLEILGNLTTLGVFLLFFMVNASLIVLTVKEKALQAIVKQYNFRKIPFLAVIGAVFCIGMFLTQYWWPINIFGFSVPLIIFGGVIFLTAIPIYNYFEGKKTAEITVPKINAVRSFAGKRKN